MSTDAPFQPPRKKINILWWIGGFFLLLVLLFFFQLFGPNPRIIVSPQTTYITEPLGQDNLPDYERYVLELYRKGVTPENNAATLMWQALWPGDLNPPQYAAVAKELGLKQIPLTEDSLVPVSGNANRQRIAAWLRRRAAKQASNKSSSGAATVPLTDGADQFDDDVSLQNAAEDAADGVLDQAMSRPWTSEQFPPLAKWIEENREPLDLIVEGSRRPRCYLPSPSLLDDESGTLIAMLLPCVQGVRETGRSLSARAMWHLGEGRIDEAWQDIHATHRIARLTSQGHTLIEQLVGIAISGTACDRTATLLHHADLSLSQAKAIRRDLADLEFLSGMADSIGSTERAMFLDTVTRLGTGRSGDLWDEVGIGNGSLFTAVSVDWNVVLRRGNEYYDRCAAAARLPTRDARKQAFSQIDGDVLQMATDFRTPATFITAAFSQARRSDAVAAVMVSLFLPALDAAMNAQDRGSTTLELTRLAAALAVYRAERGAYPERLDDLAPGVLELLPVDLYNAKPYIYKRYGEGYLLYSAGENGADDGGSNKQMSVFEGLSPDDNHEAEADSLEAKIPAGADDISIRVPRPAFELPKVPPPTDQP